MKIKRAGYSALIIGSITAVWCALPVSGSGLRTERSGSEAIRKEVRILSTGDSVKSRSNQYLRVRNPVSGSRIELGVQPAGMFTPVGLLQTEHPDTLTRTRFTSASDRPGRGRQAVIRPFENGERKEHVYPRYRIRPENSPVQGRLIRRNNVTRTQHVGTPIRKTGGDAASAAISAGNWWAYLYDDFDGDFPGYWILEDTPTWGTTSVRAATGSKSVWCAGSDYVPSQGYQPDMNAWMIDGPFDLRNTTNISLFFDYYVDTEEYTDELFVGISSDGNNFSGNAYSGFSGGWILNERIDLDEYAGESVLYVGVQFLSDSANSAYEGAYVDTIELDGYIDSDANVDLALENVEIVDAVDEVFGFDVVNYGPGTAAEDSYTLDVYVDNVLDSSARNSYPLYANEAIYWEWALTYQYVAGVHTVRVECLPDDGDINPANNTVTFLFNIPQPLAVDLEPYNVRIINSYNGSFDFDVYNAGPGSARPETYLVSVYVDNQFDSDAVNSQELFPGASSLWQWDLAYLYPEGDHTVEIEVTTWLHDTDPANNSIFFNLYVPEKPIVTDLKLYRFKMLDPANDIFKFTVLNRGPDFLYSGEYYVQVFVDNYEDSFTYNEKDLFVGWKAEWNWQLAYIYPPGLHLVTVDAFSVGAELTPDNNTFDFQIAPVGNNLTIPAVNTCTVQVSTAFSVQLSATNGTPPYAWYLQDGMLPAGIALGGDGILAGEATEPGAYTCTAAVIDRSGAAAYATVSLVVTDTSTQAPHMYDTVPPPGVAETYYETQLSAAGGTAPYTWSAPAWMPAGLGLDSNGLISGTPVYSGSYLVPVRVRGQDGFSSENNLALTVLEKSQVLRGTVTKCVITIPWQNHQNGNPESDSLKLNAKFSIPDHYVVDEYAWLTVYVGGYPVNFSLPAKAKWQKKAVFKLTGESNAKGKATVKLTSSKQIALALTIKKADIASMLAAQGIKPDGPATSVLPVRIEINQYDTGNVGYMFNYTMQGTKGKLKK